MIIDEFEMLVDRCVQLNLEMRSRIRSKATGRIPILSEYLTIPTRLRASHRGKSLKAHVRRDGTIRFKGINYNSPSAAGRAAVGRACDGWHFWAFERAPGDWVKLNELRK
jgi:hypothetical protein